MYTGANIVRDGLVLALDAANTKSYPGSGTTWNDISGNNRNGTLTNGPTFNSANGGSIFTDGTNDVITTTYSGSATDNYTFSAWFKNDNYSETKFVLCRGRDGFGGGWSLQINIDTAGKAGASVVPTLPGVIGLGSTGTTTLLLNTWYYITGLWTSSTSIKVYVNGVLEGTTSATGRTSLRTSTNGWCLGSVSNTLFTSGYTAAAHIYNVALTDAQILQNYNALKSRYNL